ncbi:Uncharacterised ACR, YggU family COG1872 [Legionella donaldsonii]|uniref:UPF0235 protein NCTC13292_02688 n=1 Tax=Legionella donaldsonii TaxID=45060 RepID=A0A378JBG4_9GAMM|nr:DUF167 domain-containing protein [Legionella donaldsonii]STX44321.1 Uncharacterised ACR, YggU family COG1872 [Legionella donaldsonii]
MNYPPWLKREAGQFSLQLNVKPGSRQNAVKLDPAGGLQICLQASPQDGKANKMLIQYLAKLLRLQQKQIVILRGTTSRLKVLLIKTEADEQEKTIQKLLDSLP